MGLCFCEFCMGSLLFAVSWHGTNMLTNISLLTSVGFCFNHSHLGPTIISSEHKAMPSGSARAVASTILGRGDR